MSDGWYVKANDIQNWCNTNQRQAQETLPLFIKKLIFATVESSLVQKIDIPSGDSISKPNYDGVVIIDKSCPYVPEGTSVWEIGTNKDVQKKANEDYNKRTSDPLGFNRKNTTYIFVTSRKWSNKNKWEIEKNNENKWKKVTALDADDLETWIEKCPSVHCWFAKLIGKLPEGIQDIEYAWKNWSSSTNPKSSEDLAIGGRDKDGNEIIEKVKTPPSIIRISSDSVEESYAFALAILRKYAEDLSHRVLIVKDEKNWSFAVENKNPLVLIPHPHFNGNYNPGFAKEKGHSVMIPESFYKLDERLEGTIKLPRMKKNSLIIALKRMGLNENDAEDVVKSCHGYLLPIRRHKKLNPSGSPKNHEWLTNENAMPLITAFLVGAWDSENQNDCDKVAEIANTTYDNLDKTFNMIKKCDDPPIRKVGHVWQIISREDIWYLLNIKLSMDEKILKRFGKVTIEILSELDPSYDLASEERWMASAYGKVPKYSGILRQNIAKTIAFLAANGDDIKLDSDYSIQSFISVSVKKILKDASAHLWYSLSDVLPLVAEAAPEIFLKAVESGIKMEKSPIIDLFREESDFGSCPHTGLLWAIEIVSWRLDYLGRVVKILADLSVLDPGGRYSNRPFNSLREIFLPWINQSSASLEQKLELINMLIDYKPDIGWKLMISLLPKISDDTSIPLVKPKFRNWAENVQENVNAYEYYEYIDAIVKKVVKQADENLIRWPEVIENAQALPEKSFEFVLSHLVKKNASEFPEETSFKIFDKLREIISNHRNSPDAKWVLPKESIDKLEKVYKKFIPSDPIKKYGFLFNDYFPKSVDFQFDHNNKKESEKTIDEKRVHALEEIWNRKGLDGIEELAKSIKFPNWLGYSIGKTTFVSKIEYHVLNWLNFDNEQNLNQVATSYIKVRFSKEWFEATKKKYFDKWNEEQQVSFYLELPFCEEVLNSIKIASQNVQDLYWQKVRNYSFRSEDKKFIERVIKQFIAYKRYDAAIEIIELYLPNFEKTGLNTDFLAKTLEEMANIGDKIPNNIYGIAEIILFLQTSEEIELSRLAKIEWLYLDIFQPYGNLKPKALMKEISEEPSFFVQIVSFAFKADPPIENDLSKFSIEQRKILAKRSLTLLEMIDQIPTQKENNEINEEKLLNWIKAVEERSEKVNRRVICDEYIGKMLSHSPTDSDDKIYPCKVIRSIIEKVENENIETGFESGIINSRGAVFGSSGKNERKLANEYRKDAERIVLNYPRTSAILKRVAKFYETVANREERRNELEDL